MVDSFITTSGLWDVEMVQAEFDAADVEWILLAKLRSNAQDQLCWHYDDKDRFTVKSAYKLALKGQGFS
ncbi:UNVERIFIED_CONTAM: hypothetical protein Sradi_2369800 [Sesamum radiatum]|uniref:Uncharacterized protein n=1 Tax=Sesamum radiatum TaxID=300843 RepID=A0AAW2T6D0_SESRA